MGDAVRSRSDVRRVVITTDTYNGQPRVTDSRHYRRSSDAVMQFLQLLQDD